MPFLKVSKYFSTAENAALAEFTIGNDLINAYFLLYISKQYFNTLIRRIQLPLGGEGLNINYGVGIFMVGTVRSTMVTTNLGRTPDGRRLEVSEEIDAPAERLWDLLTDTDQWAEWGPLLSSVECDDSQIRTGTTGTLNTSFGVSLPFEVTSCVTFRWTWKIAGIGATGHRVEPLNGHSRVVFEVPLLAGGYAPVCGIALTNLAEVD